MLRATVEYFDDEPDLPLSPDETEKLYRLAVSAAGAAGVKLTTTPPAGDPTPSFRAAELLPLDITFKQQLISSRNERERVAKLQGYLETWMEQQKRKERLSSLSRTNGKAH